jgi:hypothetical protein
LNVEFAEDLLLAFGKRIFCIGTGISESILG